MLPEVVSLDQGQNGLCRIVIDRPKGNVLTSGVMAELAAAIRTAARLPATRLITITGAGPHFSFGAAIEEHVPDQIRRVLPVFRDLILQVAGSDVPVAAVVRGVCFGGAFELVAACHLVFAAPDARMALPEVRLGVFPPPACALLPMRVGQSITDRMVVAGEEMSGGQMHACGFVTRCFPAGELDAGVAEWFAQTLAPMSASSIRHATRAARRQFCGDLEARLLDAENAYLGPLMETADAHEGIASYLGKRAPNWSNA
jgi:cyclohexa-1,5-dienecarbonyl-CoA hydratase